MEDLLDPDVFIGTADSFLSDDAAISPQPQPDFNTNLLSPPKKSNKRSSSTQIKTENASEDGSPAKKSKSANGTPRKVRQIDIVNRND